MRKINKNIKLFTHDDLDGYGCAIVALHTFDKVDITHCTNNNVNDKVKEFFDSGECKRYDKVFITDISINKELANMINQINQYELKFQLIDHHATAKWLNQYDWANVYEYEVGEDEEMVKSSATSMYYRYLCDSFNTSIPDLTSFIEMVRRYDTWEWSTKYNDQKAKQLNDLFWLMDKDEFVIRFVNNPSINFTIEENMLLKIESSKITKYIDTKKKQLLVTTICEHRVGVVFAEQYQSELGNCLANEHKDLDYIIMIDLGNNKVSYRGIHEEIDLSLIAKENGGGGHPRAAGSPISDNAVMKVLKIIFEGDG